ncbi:MAG: tRNA uridine-5-carboxymethylaminomethyl(34) synthesis GTPase MnmE, partial [Spirochaetes bacterium]|nr:tRNA uridine-5-carboxymethylaminomethyl(34) synthesis GTPase MnmE [Spirochaetota bacterium]
MFDDTICAPSTPPVNSSIAVIRMSGPDSLRVLSSCFSAAGRLEPRRAVYGSITDGDAVVDDVVAVYYRAPASFTGEEMAEVSCHGNPIIVKKILDLFTSRGARLAQPGEFSRRAFLNGKIDLTAAEAINHIVRARGEWEIRAALDQMHGSLRGRLAGIREKLVVMKADIECGIDFADEGIEFISATEAGTRLSSMEEDLRDIRRRCAVGEKLSHGIDLPIVGRPNVGKSSILNLILNAERAIVSDIPGTTRDLIRETVQFGGIHVNLFDTAGIAEPGCAIEEKGMALSRLKIGEASIVLAVFDAAAGAAEGDREIVESVKGKPCFFLANKIDLVPAGERRARIDQLVGVAGAAVIPFSAKTGEGMEALERAIVEQLLSEFVDYRGFY